MECVASLEVVGESTDMVNVSLPRGREYESPP